MQSSEHVTPLSRNTSPEALLSSGSVTQTKGDCPDLFLLELGLRWSNGACLAPGSSSEMPDGARGSQFTYVGIQEFKSQPGLGAPLDHPRSGPSKTCVWAILFCLTYTASICKRRIEDSRNLAVQERMSKLSHANFTVTDTPITRVHDTGTLYG